MNVKVSMLDDIRKLKEKELITNACLIYSMWSGYIEKDEKLKKFIERIGDMGIDFKELHTSGHADVTSMKRLNEIVNPDKTIIIHTENRKNGVDVFNNIIDLDDNQIFKI